MSRSNQKVLRVRGLRGSKCKNIKYWLIPFDGWQVNTLISSIEDVQNDYLSLFGVDALFLILLFADI
jgi:hypothetical protein